MRKSNYLYASLVLLFTGVIMMGNLSSVSAAIAKGTYTDHQNALGNVLVDIEQHPSFLIDGFHYDYGDLGSGDVIRIWRYINLPIGPMYLPVAIFADNSQRIDLFHLIYGAYPTSIQLINPSAIEVVREGSSKNVHLVWKTDLVVPDELWGPTGSKTLVSGITIPPGMLVIRGHGDLISGTELNGGPTKPYSQTVTWTGYKGDATFVCPTWHFGGPVGVNEGVAETSMRIDATVVTTIN